MISPRAIFPAARAGALLLLGTAVAHAADWPTWGKDATRHGVSPEKNPPIAWTIEGNPDNGEWSPGTNVKWLVGAGNPSFSTPVIANGFIWLGTNNEHPRDPAFKDDAAVLMCFRARDGVFVWQYVAPRKKGVRFDWQQSGMKCSPTIEGTLMWFITPGADVVCLDLAPLYEGNGVPKELWKLDLSREFQVFIHPSPMGWSGAVAVACYRDWIYVNTGNGVEWDHLTIAHPEAPSLVCLEKRTGRVIWTDRSPGNRIFHEQWSAPLVFEAEGKAHIVSGFGDGYLRCFAAVTGSLEWAVDCNPASYRAKKYPGAEGPSEILAVPMYAQGKIYVTIGQDPEHGEGVGNLVCVDAVTGRVLWENHTIHRSLSTPLRIGDRLYVADFSGFVHCLDAETGTLRWRFDCRAHVWGSPLWVDGRLFLGDEDGDAMVFDLEAWEQALPNSQPPLLLGSPQPNLVTENSMGAPLYSQPIFVDGVLYMNTVSYLCAIAPATPVSPGQGVPAAKRKVPDTTFASTVSDMVDKMLDMAQVKASDLVYDLGSGDGRILIAAASRYGCRAVGYEIDPTLVQRSREAVRQKRLEKLVQIEAKDLFTADLAKVDVLVLYLPSSVLAKLKPQLKQLKPGARVVSHEFVIPGVPADRSIRIKSSEDGTDHVIHLWTAPLTMWTP